MLHREGCRESEIHLDGSQLQDPRCWLIFDNLLVFFSEFLSLIESNEDSFGRTQVQKIRFGGFVLIHLFCDTAIRQCCVS